MIGTPFKCPYGGEWRYTQEELEAGAPGGIVPDEALYKDGKLIDATKKPVKKAVKREPYGDPM